MTTTRMPDSGPKTPRAPWRAWLVPATLTLAFPATLGLGVLADVQALAQRPNDVRVFDAATGELTWERGLPVSLGPALVERLDYPDATCFVLIDQHDPGARARPVGIDCLSKAAEPRP